MEIVKERTMNQQNQQNQLNFYKDQALDAMAVLATDYRQAATKNKNPDMQDMYDQDHADILKCIDMFRADDPEELADFVCSLDTSVREDVVCAFAEDCGEDWVTEVLGWSVR